MRNLLLPSDSRLGATVGGASRDMLLQPRQRRSQLAQQILAALIFPFARIPLSMLAVEDGRRIMVPSVAIVSCG